MERNKYGHVDGIRHPCRSFFESFENNDRCVHCGFLYVEHADYWEGKFRVSRRSSAHGQKVQPIRVAPRLGRNELCNCGSGRKYKDCCMKR